MNGTIDTKVLRANDNRNVKMSSVNFFRMAKQLINYDVGALKSLKDPLIREMFSLERLEEISERRVSYIKSIHEFIEREKIDNFKVNKRTKKAIGRFYQAVEELSQAHEELCYDIATQKPWGQE